MKTDRIGQRAHETWRYARFVVEVVSDPSQFESKADARQALFEALTDLSRSLGVEPADDLERAFGLSS